ncbi:pyridoxamine 5'-phosphate oxidase family protein [Williamsia maris]
MYGATTERDDDGPDHLDEREIALLGSVFQFHLATVTAGGHPYIQYRSGPRGFLHHLGDNTIGFADFHGNAQFVSVGNIDDNGRVAMFVADYPRKIRLKLFGRATVVDAADDPDLLARLVTVGDTRIAARAERSIVITIEAFDWNCSRSLVPQYDRDYVRALNRAHSAETEELRTRIADLERLVTGS